MVVSWNAEKDQAFFIQLLVVLDVKPTREQWSAVAQQLGPEYTAEALRQHYQSIRRRVALQKQGGDMQPATNGAGKAAGKAVSAKNSEEGPTTKGPKRKADNMGIKEADQAYKKEDSESEMATYKKPRTKKSKAEQMTLVKEEGGDDSKEGLPIPHDSFEA